MRKAGAEKTKEWYMHLPAGVYPSHMDGLTDNTHLKYMGAVVYAGCIARGLKELGGIYSDLLVLGSDPLPFLYQEIKPVFRRI